MSKKEPHPTMSFTDLVAKKNTDTLKPYIDQQINQLGMKLAQGQLGALAPTLLRLSALEDVLKEKLGETDESLATRVVEMEDRALGVELSQDAAAAGDTVRYSIQINGEGQLHKQTARNLGKPRTDSTPEQLQIQQALIGLSAGEATVVEIPGAKLKLLMERVSKAPKKIPITELPIKEFPSEVAKPEGDNVAASSDAQ